MTTHSFVKALDRFPADTSPTAHLLDELQLHGYPNPEVRDRSVRF